MSTIEILCEMVRLHDLGIRPQVVRGMWREEQEWKFAIEQARQRVSEWNKLIEIERINRQNASNHAPTPSFRSYPD